MKEFRIAECLGNDGIHEYAIFADGSRKKMIQNDEQYGKYFEVDNELNPNGKTLLRYSFSGRIKDAVDMIKNGNGDCIKQINLFGKIDKVIYFLDRRVGEELRNKSLEGWKNTKFAWAVECGYKNSFSGYLPIKADYTRLSILDEDRAIKTFETYEDAENFIQELIFKAYEYSKNMVAELHDVSIQEERDAIIDKTLKAIEDYTGSKFSVLEDFLSDMLKGDCKLKSDECKLDEMGYKIVQCIV